MKKISAILWLLLAVCLAFGAFAACKPEETPSETYTVTFKNGDEVVSVKTVKAGECVSELPVLTLANDEQLDGWFAGDKQFTTATAVTHDVTVVAKISAKPDPEPDETEYSVTLKIDDETVLDTVKRKENATLDLYEYSTMYYEIHEWTDENGTKYNFDDLYVVTKDAILTAVNPKAMQFTMQLSPDKQYYSVIGLIDTESSSLTVPETYFNLPVKEIAPNAFAGFNNTLEKLTVNSSVEIIGEKAFAGLYGLKELTVPFVGEHKCTEVSGNGLKGLFAYWFAEEISVDYRPEYVRGTSVYYEANGEDAEPSIDYTTRFIPKSLTKIIVNGGAVSDYAFHTVTTIETVFLGDEVTALGEHAFGVSPQNTDTPSSGYRLKYVECGENSKLASIGEGCFNNQINLEKVCIGSKVKIIPESLFRGFEKLGEIVLYDNSELEIIGDNAFFGAPIRSINLPETLTAIGTHAFAACNNLTEASIPKETTKLSPGIFRNCEGLTNAAFHPQANLSAIPAYMFDGCLKLENVAMPAAVVKIEDNAFSNCRLLSNLDDDEIGFELQNVTYIGANAFTATGFKYVDISENITYIGAGAFSGCASLAGIYFNDTSDNCKLTEIGAHTFDGCDALTQIELPDSVTEIGFRAFSYTGLITIDLPANLETIGDLAFFLLNDAKAALKTVNISELTKLTSIGESAFENNILIEVTSLPESLKHIGDKAFCNSGIRGTITLNPALLTEIGANAFANCTKATLEVIGAVNDLPRKWNASWAGIGANSTKVSFTEADPDDVPLFEQFEGYEENEICYVTKYVGNNAEVVLQDSFAGKTVIYKQSVFAGNTTITSVTLAPNMTEIPRSFFANCEKLQTVTVPAEAKIMSIGDYAFNNCYELMSFTISDASELTYIGDYAFYHAYSTTFIKLTNNVRITYIGDYAFQMRLPTYNCALIELNLDLTKTEYIGDYAFQGCYDLIANYELTSTVERIGEAAFKGCSKVNLTLKEGFKLSRFENGVFESVTKLVWENIDFTDVEYIGDDAFHSTNALSGKKFAIPNTVTYIGNNAFHTTKAAGVIIDCNSELEIGDYAFGYGADNFYAVIKGTPKKIGYAICCTTNRAHIYFTETITVSTTYPQVFTLGDGGCEINNMFYIYNEDYEHAVNVPYFGKGQWTADENGEPIHPADGHKESASR